MPEEQKEERRWVTRIKIAGVEKQLGQSTATQQRRLIGVGIGLGLGGGGWSRVAYVALEFWLVKFE